MELKRLKVDLLLLDNAGTKFKPGKFVGCGRDHTLYALKDGIVNFTRTGYIDIIEETSLS